MNEQVAPISEGETHEVSIKSVGEKGDGIARINGFVVFVSGTKKGDYVKVKITKVLPKVGFAQVLEKLERPKKKHFVQVSMDELKQEEDLGPSPDDTDDFGADLDDED